MQTEAIETKVVELVKEALNSDQPLDLDRNLIDYGADSLDTVEIVLAVEEEFGIELPDDLIDGLDTARKIAATVDKIVNVAAA